MSHTPAWRGCAAGDERSYRFGHMLRDVSSGALFVVDADFADHNHMLSVRIFFKHLYHVDETGAVNRITANAHTGRLADAALGQRVNHFIGQRTAARDNTHRTGVYDRGGNNTNFGAAPLTDGRDQARAVWPNQAAAFAV